MNRETYQRIFEVWCKKLRLSPDWDVRLEWFEDPDWHKTGDFKVDCGDKKAILMLNAWQSQAGGKYGGNHRP